MRKFIKIFKRNIGKQNDRDVYLLPLENLKAINDHFLLENITTHKFYSETINACKLWDNFTFDHELGSMEFSNDAEGFVFALDKESLCQAEAMLKLNNQLTIFTKVLPSGYIFVNLYTSEFNQLYTCSSIRWFKKE